MYGARMDLEIASLTATIVSSGGWLLVIGLRRMLNCHLWVHRPHPDILRRPAVELSEGSQI